MLVYELFLKNKDVEDETIGEAIPCKKVYAKYVNNDFMRELDQKTIDEYGKKVLPEAEKLQNLLHMPLMNQMSVGLPNYTTGENSKAPYVSLKGMLKSKKIVLSIEGKTDGSKGSMSISFDLTNNQVVAKVEPSLTLRIENGKYFVGDQLLFNEYVASGIIDNNGQFSGKLFKCIGNSFIEYCKTRYINEEFKDNKRTISFRVVVLPYSIKDQNKTIVYKKGNAVAERSYDMGGESIRLDAFNFPMDSYASSPVFNDSSKFFSYDDKAFTINCYQAESFYKTLGIGNRSLEKIKMPTNYPISGLSWYFIPLFENLEFQKISGGLYAQLKQIYAELTLGKKSVSDRAELKIICTKHTRAKVEVILDENLTINQLAENFKLNSELSASSPLMAFEDVFLIKNRQGEVVDWSPYITAIRSCISGLGLEKDRILALLTRHVRDKLFDWIKEMPNRSDAQSFFEKAAFCTSLMMTKNNGGEIMDANEEYAYRIGKIAGEYINYKLATEEPPNSLYDILTYPKYDRERLRYVYRKISLAFLLSKEFETQGQSVVQAIADLIPKHEIDDTKSDTDFSYFFYKGLFEKLRGV